MRIDRKPQQQAVHVLRERIELITDKDLNYKLHMQFNEFVRALNMALAQPND